MIRADNLTNVPTELEVNVAKLYGPFACLDCESEIAWDFHCTAEDVHGEGHLFDASSSDGSI